ncbi:hypothetical protein [Neptunitalea lumnitzerae]|uniref:Secreted protein n=1 Tax=Neptunitalea lumnitzerae TaxID=2965509 RepID=A0ABQ5MK98_9FLAO|nr:hypothetical protein [Neptunitalea sp. Y10]GLB49475.1 hypothetical protein Y10_18430 [Neptunitalea sp. Y10]
MKKFYIVFLLIVCILPLSYSCNPEALSEDLNLYEQQSKTNTGDDDDTVPPPNTGGDEEEDPETTP